MNVLLEGTDWTLVTALLSAIATQSAVIVALWIAYNGARNKYEDLLRTDRDELVPQMVQLADRATTLNANAEKLLAESLRLRGLRTGRERDRDDGTSA